MDLQNLMMMTMMPDRRWE